MNASPPILLVVSGPSGAGKSTLVSRYTQRHPATCLVTSVTTRAPRESEVPGEDYVFLSREEFERGLAEDAFLEFAEVHGNYYGTPRAAVNAAFDEGRDVILEIDVQGGQQVVSRMAGTVLCFLTPSSQAELLARLRSRAEDAEEVIAKRLKNAAKEYEALRSYHYRIVNDDIEEAYATLRAVVLAEKAALRRQAVDDMVAEYTKGVTASLPLTVGAGG